jgi:hypothetical protein
VSAQPAEVAPPTSPSTEAVPAEVVPATTQPPPLHLATLSDEELVLLDAEHPLVPLPHYERLDPAQQQLAVRGALRGFRTRGHDVDSAARTIALPQHVCDLLDLRAAATCVLLVQVVVPVPGADSASVMQHLAFVDEDFVLLEDVSGEGLHDFWALDLADLAAEVQARIPVLDDARDGTGGAVDVDLMAVAAGESRVTVDRLGRPLVQVDATVWRAPATPEPVLQGIVIGDRGTYTSAARFGAEGPVTLTPIAVSAVGEEVVRRLHADTMGR